MINELYRLIDDEKIDFIEDDLTSINMKGLYFDNVIVLDKNIDTEAERKCIIAEELGHYETSSKVILDQSNLHNQKEEERARRWAVDQLINPNDFINAFRAGVSGRSELAEFLSVTEEFIELSLKHFSKVYGERLTIDNYIIFFDPLWVYKGFE